MRRCQTLTNLEEEAKATPEVVECLSYLMMSLVDKPNMPKRPTLMKQFVMQAAELLVTILSSGIEVEGVQRKFLSHLAWTLASVNNYIYVHDFESKRIICGLWAYMKRSDSPMDIALPILTTIANFLRHRDFVAIAIKYNFLEFTSELVKRVRYTFVCFVLSRNLFLMKGSSYLVSILNF